MTLTTLSSESQLQGAFYAPQFQVKIQGVGLPRDVLRDVIKITYKDDVKQLDNFELTVNNWDPTSRQFKYIGAETTDTLQGGGYLGTLQHLFDPGIRPVDVLMGYLPGLRTMLTGNFTTLEPTFPASGAPTLTIRGLNALQQFRKVQYTNAWTGLRASEIAQNMDGLRDPKDGSKRLPFPIEIDNSAMSLEDPIDYLAQNNQYDVEFLLALARKNAYVFLLLEGDPSAQGIKQKKRLYFGPSQGGQNMGMRDVTFDLAWGQSLVEFKPTLTTANQIKSVTVKGWNRKTKQPISATVTINDPQLKVNKDLQDLFAQKADPREEVVVDEPVFTPAQARQRAVSILSDRHKEMVKATGSTVGLPDLRAGRRVQIDGVGARFSGTYFVTDTTHTIDESGYTTHFSARREDTGGQSS